MRRKISWNWYQVFTIILTLLIIVFSIKAVQEILNRRSLNNELDNLDKQIVALQAKQQDLESLMNYLQSWDFVEKEARTRLNLRKDGERVIIIPESSSTPAERLDESYIATSSAVQLSNFQKWWQYIFPKQ